MTSTRKIKVKYIDKKKLLKQNGSYNLVQLKTHLQDEGILDEDDIFCMIATFSKLIRTMYLTKEMSPIS